MFIIHHDYHAINFEHASARFTLRANRVTSNVCNPAIKNADTEIDLAAFIDIKFDSEVRSNQTRMLIPLTACTTFPVRSLA